MCFDLINVMKCNVYSKQHLVVIVIEKLIHCTSRYTYLVRRAAINIPCILEEKFVLDQLLLVSGNGRIIYDYNCFVD